MAGHSGDHLRHGSTHRRSAPAQPAAGTFGPTMSRPDPHEHVVLLCLLLAGCAPSGLGPAWVEVGGGRDAHVPLHDGDVVDIVRGPQLGYMLAVSVGATGVLAGDPVDPTDPDNPRVTFQSFLLDDPEALGSITVVRGLTEGGTGVLELAGSWLVFDAARDTSTWFDHVIEVRVQITDALGNTATDTATVTAAWTDPGTGEPGR